jgi:hypothetical protein
MTGGPNVKFGTKWLNKYINYPSMTSKCNESAPSYKTLLHYSRSLAKSAARIEGAMTEVSIFLIG